MKSELTFQLWAFTITVKRGGEMMGHDIKPYLHMSLLFSNLIGAAVVNMSALISLLYPYRVLKAIKVSVYVF